MTTPYDPSALVGTWRLERLVEDRRAGRGSHVTGSLSLTLETPRRLCWSESGTWYLPTGPVPVHRVLHVEREPDRWWVRFTDGRPFHPWLPDEAVVHPCGLDTYTGLVTGDTEAWTVRWDVRGPEKDYAMTTRLTGRRTSSRAAVAASAPVSAGRAGARRPAGRPRPAGS